MLGGGCAAVEEFVVFSGIIVVGVMSGLVEVLNCFQLG